MLRLAFWVVGPNAPSTPLIADHSRLPMFRFALVTLMCLTPAAIHAQGAAVASRSDTLIQSRGTTRSTVISCASTCSI